MFLQETHSKDVSEQQWANEWGGKAFFSHGSPDSCGVAILIRNKLCNPKIHCWSVGKIYYFEGRHSVFMSSVLSPPSKIIKQVNSMIFSFLWNGEDNVTRLSSINSPEDGGIKMTDIESLDKAVRLAWLKSIFSDNESTWKFYLLHLLRNVGGLLLFKCNYAMNDLSINSVFYRELLECWLEFRNLFLAYKERLCIIWNNKDIRKDGRPVFYKSHHCYDLGICIIKNLLACSISTI